MTFKKTPVKTHKQYRYWYNGKEWQNDLELNLYDYGARQYDPAVGRWFAVDPASEVTPDFSPYVYVYNSPLFYYDPTGMLGEAITSTFIDPEGKVIEHRNDGDPLVYLVWDVNKWIENGKRKDSLPVVGFEDWRINYKPGDQYVYYNPTEDPEYNGQYMIPALAYDYSEEVIEGKFEEDWAYILHGTEGSMIYRFYKILERDITAEENRGTVISAGSDILFALPVFKIGKITYRFGNFKSSTKWLGQMNRRGWTPKMIQEALNTGGEMYNRLNKVNPGNPLRIYRHPTSNRAVIVDDVTKEIIQLTDDLSKWKH